MVVEDVRGRYESEARFDPFTQEPRDGDDTLNWIARQPWSDGKIGMLGGSYLGIVQWKAALAEQSPFEGHRAGGFRLRRLPRPFLFYRRRVQARSPAAVDGGKPPRARISRCPDFDSFVRVTAAAPGRRGGHRTTLRDLSESSGSSQRRCLLAEHQHARAHRSGSVPVFSVGGWYDNFVESDLEAFSALRRNSGVHRIMIGPWPHNMSIKFDNADFGTESGAPVRRMQLEWFDQWLKSKDTPLMSQPPVHIFVMGANRWRDEHEWPLARARLTPLYLAGKGRANTLNGRWRAGRPSASNAQRPIDLSSIRAIQCRPRAEQCAAIQKSSPGDRWTSGLSNCVRMFWYLPPLRSPRISK